MIHERPAAVESPRQAGHWEIDTVMGAGQQGGCVITPVERKTGFVLIGKLPCRIKDAAIRVIVALTRRHRDRFKTITADNGTEFHCYRAIEAATGVKFYFATPHHAWERGTSENTNGLIRQYLPKGQCMRNLIQKQCDHIAQKLNDRPRKRQDYRTPAERYLPT